jgi:hypothetical protein
MDAPQTWRGVEAKVPSRRQKIQWHQGRPGPTGILRTAGRDGRFDGAGGAVRTQWHFDPRAPIARTERTPPVRREARNDAAPDRQILH